MNRKVIYISGTRADFGLMESTLKKIATTPGLELGVVVTGMHLDSRYGLTVGEVEASGLRLAGRVPVPGDATELGMARNIGAMVTGIAELLAVERPDAVLVLGDRGEMLAAAIGALHLRIPVVHIHGGERSGTVDEPVRHAISKLAQFHLVATQESKERLIRMGEADETVFVVGAPGLDGLASTAIEPLDELAPRLGIDAGRAFALVVYHPVHDEVGRGGQVMDAIVQSLLAHGLQVVALAPNSDAGSDAIRERLQHWQAEADVNVLKHLSRDEYISALASAAVLVGNSSSGIIEAASLGTPVLNIGRRQNMRQRNSNTVDVSSVDDIPRGLISALAMSRSNRVNVYGDGHAGERIVAFLAGLPAGMQTAMKTNAY